jgi:hypothetical protein
MDTKLYLTVAAIVAILYALAFLVIPVQASLFFSDFAEPRAVLYLRFCGAAILAWGLIVWFARNFEGRYAVRSSQRRRPCSQHRNKCVGDVAGLAQRQSVGFGGSACVALARGSL